MTEQPKKQRGRRRKNPPEAKTGPRARIPLIALMAEKSKKEGRMILPADVIREAGVDRNTIYRALTEELPALDFRDAYKLAKYFEVPPGALLEMVDE